MYAQQLPPARVDHPIITFNAQGIIESVNRQAETLLGYTEKELTNQHLSRLLPAAYRSITNDMSLPTLTRLHLQVLGEGLQILAARKDQTLLLINIKFHKYLTDNGVTFHAVIEDLATRALTPKNALGVLQNSSQQIIVFDAESLFFISASNGALNNLQYSMDELSTRTPVDLAVNLSTTELEQSLEAALKSDHPVEISLRLRRKNKTEFESVLNLQLAQLGSTPTCIGLIHNLQCTQRHQAELFPSFSDKLIATLQGIVLLLDTEGKILQCNPYFEALTGYSAAELDGADYFDIFIPQEARAEMRIYFAEVVKRGGNDGHINRINMKNGGDRQIQWHSSLLKDFNGHAMGLLCTGSDVTQQTENTAALEQAIKKVEQATQGKSRFLAAASHDLRQPLQSLGMYLAVLNAKLDNPILLEIAGKMEQSLTSMRELLDALLDISRFDKGAVKPKVSNFPLQPLLDRIVTDNIQQAEAKGIHLVAEQQNFMVESDPGLLERLLENLVTNATRYTNSGEVNIGCEADGTNVNISVCDTGIGIPAEDLERVFDEYYQIENANRAKNKGLGLGLAIVRHIADLLNHPLRVSSEVDKWSTFSVSVPASTTNALGLLAPLHPHHAGNQPLVLLVDDDASIVDATLMLLETEQVSVLTAGDGDTALDHISNGAQPDILITDFRLPGYNGIELVKRLRTALGRELPVVMMTGDTSAQDFSRAQLSNCTLLHKPVDTNDLLRLIYAVNLN
jgi:PAS domain S-box-containing protein